MMDQLTCHLEHVCEHVSALRVYAHGQSYDAGAPYVFACNVKWLTPDHTRVELGLAIGEMCKEVRQAIVARLIHEGVQHCYAQRHGHRVELIEHGAAVQIKESSSTESTKNTKKTVRNLSVSSANSVLDPIKGGKSC